MHDTQSEYRCMHRGLLRTHNNVNAPASKPIVIHFLLLWSYIYAKEIINLSDISAALCDSLSTHKIQILQLRLSIVTERNLLYSIVLSTSH